MSMGSTVSLKAYRGACKQTTSRTEGGSVVCLFFKHLVNRQHCPLLVFWKTWTFFLMADYCGLYRHRGPLEGMLSVFTNRFCPPLYAFKATHCNVSTFKSSSGKAPVFLNQWLCITFTSMSWRQADDMASRIMTSMSVSGWEKEQSALFSVYACTYCTCALCNIAYILHDEVRVCLSVCPYGFMTSQGLWGFPLWCHHTDVKWLHINLMTPLTSHWGFWFCFCFLDS